MQSTEILTPDRNEIYDEFDAISESYKKQLEHANTDLPISPLKFTFAV